MTKYTDGEATRKNNTVTNGVRQAWNDFVKYLGDKGLRGHPNLDKNNFGNDMLNQYIRENPLTPLRPEMVKPIQEDFAKYREFALDQVKQGKFALQEGVTPDNFMKELSQLDAWPGSYTTKHSFPREYLEMQNAQHQTESVQDKGFATIK